NVGGLVGFDRSRVSASYWDTETSGLATSAAGTGKTTAELQEPAGYTGIYANWNEDLDGDGSDDDPWDFGTSCQYPVLKFGSFNPDDQRDPCDPAGLPGPVTGLDLSATFDSVTVSWSAPESGNAPRGYIAYLKPEGGSAGSGKTRRPGADKTTVTFDNLESSQTYRVWVRAQNEAGKGERVRASITLPTEPPGLVTGLTLTATEGAADSVTVSWQAPETGGAPDGYIAHLRPQGSAEGSGRTKRPKASKTQVTFGNLESGTTYKVWVRAENEAGKGERVLAEITLEAVSAYCPDPVNDDYDDRWHFGFGRPPYDESLFGVSRVHVAACVNARVPGADDMAVLSLSLPEGVTIDPEFSSKNYSYRLTVPGELDHLTFTGRFTSELWGSNIDELAGAILVAGLVGQYDAFTGNTEESGYSITIATNSREGNPNRIELAPDAVTMISIEMRKSRPGETYKGLIFKTFYTLAVTRGDPPANAAPTVASPISDVSGLAAGSTRDVSLSGVFSDADGDSLTVTSTSSDDAIATVSVAADYSSLTVTGVAEGTATVTVTAQDSHGNQVSDAFDVSVVEAEITSLTITPNNPTREYGEADDLAYSVGGLLDGDAATDVVTGTLSRASGDDAGDYAI
ncbi:MAG: fibronectin type III domain-containing protein, partial [Chloroflexi bacterium]|nr:fibronectin type III domain-containing protein [Chloroflexota bacterium]